MRNSVRNLIGATALTLVLIIGAASGTGDAPPLSMQVAPPEVDVAVENAQLVIEGPTKGDVGELIRLDVSSSQGQSFKWLLVPDSVDFEIYDNGRRAVFSARNVGEYTFIIACAYNDTVDVITHTVTIVKPGEPDPNKEYPKVDEPAAGASLSKLLPYWCSLAKRERGEALSLAESFESVAAAVAAGAYVDPAEISKATGEANRTALGPVLESWMPILSKLQAELQRLANAEQLQTPEQHAKVWREIAAGLLDYAAMFNPC